MQITDHLSPNCGPRRDGILPSLVVIHYTAMDSCEAACTRLCDPVTEVSAHYLIGITGQVLRLVPEDQRAWHAGAGEWNGLEDVNSQSIGIELDNRGLHPFSAPQMDSLEQLLQGILERWKIPPSGVIGHSDMAPMRKSDPGPHFDWQRLERQGLAEAGQSSLSSPPVDAQEFRKRAVAKGYTAPADDDALLSAVRLRYRPWGSGPLTVDDMRIVG